VVGVAACFPAHESRPAASLRLTGPRWVSLLSRNRAVRVPGHDVPRRRDPGTSVRASACAFTQAKMARSEPFRALARRPSSTSVVAAPQGHVLNLPRPNDPAGIHGASVPVRPCSKPVIFLAFHLALLGALGSREVIASLQQCGPPAALSTPAFQQPASDGHNRPTGRRADRLSMVFAALHFAGARGKQILCTRALLGPDTFSGQATSSVRLKFLSGGKLSSVEAVHGSRELPSLRPDGCLESPRLSRHVPLDFFRESSQGSRPATTYISLLFCSFLHHPGLRSVLAATESCSLPPFHSRVCLARAPTRSRNALCAGAASAVTHGTAQIGLAFRANRCCSDLGPNDQARACDLAVST